MQPSQQVEIPERLRVVFTLSHLLQCLETSKEPIVAAQYRSVVRHLSEEFGRTKVDDAFRAVLRIFPAASEVYENLNYAQAGLCRLPLEMSLTTEAQAREAIGIARQTAV